MKLSICKHWLRRAAAGVMSVLLAASALTYFPPMQEADAAVTGSSNGYVSGVTYSHNTRYAGYSVVNGIDVSSYQKIIDWNKVKADGIDFAFIRVGFRGYGDSGSLNTDGMYQKNLAGAAAAGIKVGVYFYSQAITVKEGIEEANYVLERIKDYPVTLPVVIDYEYAATGVGRLYNAKLSKRAATNICAAFCDTVEAAGYQSMIYANANMLNKQLYASELSAKYQIWLAHYTTKSTYTGDYQYWQYSSKGRVSGITTGNVDCNFFYTLDSSYKNIRIDHQAVEPEAIDAKVTVSVQNPGGSIVSQIGFNLYDQYGTPIGVYSDSCGLSSGQVTFTGKVSDYGAVLQYSTNYRYQPFAVVGGKTYYGNAQSFQTTLPHVSLAARETVSENNAVIMAQVSNPAGAPVTKIGCRLYDGNGALLSSCERDWITSDQDFIFSFDVAAEMGIALAKGSTYSYELYVVHNGLTDTSERTTFKTSGTLTVDGITLNKSSLTIYGLKQSEKLTATLLPAGISTAVSWSSSNKSVATVAADGTVTSVGKGTAVITAKAGGKSASCTVTVSNDITAITLNEHELTLPVGEIALLTANTTPAEIQNPALKWVSSDPSVATVNEYGVVIAMGPGAAIITCSSANQAAVQDHCVVVVNRTLTYHLDGGTNASDNPEICGEGMTYTLSDPQKKGYLFGGWFADADLKTPVTQVSEGDGITDLYAKWEKISLEAPNIDKLYMKIAGAMYIYLDAPVEGADGYQFVYATDEAFRNKKYSSKNALKKGYYVDTDQQYYVKVRAFTIDSTGARVYGPYSAVKTAHSSSIVPEKMPDIKVASTAPGKLTVSMSKPVYSCYGYQYVYSPHSSFSGKKYKTTRNRSYTFSSLKKGTYYVKARAYYKDPVTGGYVYGAYSKVQKITIH